MRKILPVFLLASLLLASCGETAEPVPQTKAESETAPETEPAYVLWENLQKKDLEGMEFRFMEAERTADTGATVPHGNTEAITGEAINDAIYNRNRAVEEYLNCTVTTEVVKASALPTKVPKLVSSGDETYSAILGDPDIMMQLALKNNFDNLCDIDTIHLENPWYNQKQVESFTIKDKLYTVAGDIVYSTVMFGSCLIYNIDLASRLDIPSIYDIVMNGQWTVDKMYEISSGVASDLNGDGELKEDDDRFAYAIGDYGNFMNYQYSTDQCFIRYDKATEAFVDAFNVDKMSTLIEKMNRIFHDEKRGICAKDYTALFNSGRLLMRSAYVGSCVNHRGMEDGYTPIPYPKYDEVQEDYRSVMTGSVLLLGIPTSVKRPDDIGLVVEALSEHSAGELYDATNERILSYQAMRTQEAVDILNLIRKSLIVDFGYLTVGGSGESIRWVVGNLVRENSTDVASYHAKYSQLVGKYYADLLDTYDELN